MLVCALINMCIVIDSYQSTLKQLFQEYRSGEDADSQQAVVITQIMIALQTNLDGKSKQYKDGALAYLFLVNNIHYIDQFGGILTLIFCF